MPRCLPRLVETDARNWEAQSLEQQSNFFQIQHLTLTTTPDTNGPNILEVGSAEGLLGQFEQLDASIPAEALREPPTHSYRLIFAEKFLLATATSLTEITKDLTTFLGKYNQFTENQDKHNPKLQNEFACHLQEEYQRIQTGKQHNTFSKRSLEAQRNFIANNLSYLQSVDTEGRTILHFASDAGAYDLVKFILSFSKVKQAELETTSKYDQHVAFLDVNAADLNGWAPLHSALHNRHFKIAELLMTYGANVCAITKSHSTPLLILVGLSGDTSEQLRLLQMMIENGSDVCSRSIHLECALHRAAWKNSLEVVEFLVENGANVHEITKLNENALHYASMSASNTSIIEYLLGQEIDESLVGEKGSPVDVAVSPNVKEFLQSYVEWRTSPGAKIEPTELIPYFQQLVSRLHRFSLHRACQQGDLAVVSRLLKRRISLNFPDDNRMTPLQYASTYGFLDVVIVLLSTNEISLEQCGFDGGLLLHLLVRNHFPNSQQNAQTWQVVLLALKTKGFDFSFQNIYGTTALHEASFRGTSPIVFALVSACPSLLTATTKNGDTPLHWAARGGHIGAVFTLLVAGADKHARNKQGLSAIDVAKERGYSEALFLLQFYRPGDEHKISIENSGFFQRLAFQEKPPPKRQRSALRQESLDSSSFPDLIETVGKARSNTKPKQNAWLIGDNVDLSQPLSSDPDAGLTEQEASYRFLFNIQTSQFICEFGSKFLEGLQSLTGSILIWQNFLCWKGDCGFLIKLEFSRISSVQFKMPSFLKVQYSTAMLPSDPKSFVSKPPDLGLSDPASLFTIYEFYCDRAAHLQLLINFLWPHRLSDTILNIHGHPLRRVIGNILFPEALESRAKQFLEVSQEEGLVSYFNCSLRGDVLPTKGILFLSQNLICFSNSFLFSQNKKVAKLADIRSIEAGKLGAFGREKSIVAHKKGEDLVFSGFDNFTESLDLIERVWMEARQDAQIVFFATGGWINSSFRFELLKQLQQKAYIRWVLLPGGQNVTAQESLLLQETQNIEVTDLRGFPKDALFGSSADPDNIALTEQIPQPCIELLNALSKMHILVFSFVTVTPQTVLEVKTILDHCLNNARITIRHIILVGSTLVGTKNKIGKMYQAIENIVLAYCDLTKCKFTLLRITGALMQMLLQPYINIRDESLFRLPIPEAKSIAWINAFDVACIVKRIACEDSWRHYNKKYFISGTELLTCSEVAKIISEASDNFVKYFSVSPERMKIEMQKMRKSSSESPISKKDRRETLNPEHITRFHSISRPLEKNTKPPPPNSLIPDFNSFIAETILYDLMSEEEDWMIDGHMEIWTDLAKDPNDIYSLVSDPTNQLLPKEQSSSFKDFISGHLSFVTGSHTAHFTPAEYNTVWAQFQTLSPAKDMSKEDFLKFQNIGCLFCEPLNRIASAIFNGINKSPGQDISFSDFVSGLGILMRGTAVQQQRFIFRIIDQDQDGSISRRDWEHFLCAICSALHKLNIDTTPVGSLVDLIFQANNSPDTSEFKKAKSVRPRPQTVSEPLRPMQPLPEEIPRDQNASPPPLPARVSSSLSPGRDQRREEPEARERSTIPPLRPTRLLPSLPHHNSLPKRRGTSTKYSPQDIDSQLSYSEIKVYDPEIGSFRAANNFNKAPLLVVCQTLNFEQFCEALRCHESTIRSLGTKTIQPTSKLSPRSKQEFPNQTPGFMVSFGHPQWELVQNMMWGLHLSLQSRLANQLYNPTPWNESFFTESHTETLTVSPQLPDTRWMLSEFAPDAFWKIRQSFDVNQQEYQTSLGPFQAFGNLLLGKLQTYQEVVSTGRSGSFFFKTSDNNLLIKSLPVEEYSFFSKNIPSYYRHIHKHPNTAMTRFYGLYKITQKKGTTELVTVRFVVMQNIFCSPLPLFETFDLKGSTVDRSVLDKIEYWNPSIALKDRDLHQKLKVGPFVKARILEQLEYDTKWLASLNICDYSLLVGISYHDMTDFLPEPKKSPLFSEYHHGILSRDSRGTIVGSEVYFIGLIDTLTTYDFKKKGEHVLKSILHDANEISAIAPDPYRKRFLRFATKIFE